MTHVKRMIALISATTIIGSLFLTACGTTAPVAPTSAPAATTAPGTVATAVPTAATKPNPSATAAPRTYGELRVGLTGFGGAPLDPQISPGPTGKNVTATMFDELFGVSDAGQLGPGIAEKWDVSADAKTWTLYIRKGVKFHDGSDLTAADAKFSIERILAPESVASYAANLRTAVDKLELKDDYTLAMTLKNSDPEIWKWLSLFGGTEGMVVPKKYIEEKGVQYFRDHPVGSGPWKFVSYDPSNKLVLEATSSHWRNVPTFQKLTITAVPEESTRLAMLKTGELDVIQLSPEKVTEAKSAGLGVVAVENAMQSGVAFYPDLANKAAFPIGDVRVRKALSLAINRQEMANTLFAGLSKPTAMYGMPSTSMYFDANVIKPDPYDPTQAKALLAEAGFPNGFSMKMFPALTVSFTPLLAQAVVGYWDKVGVKAAFDQREYAALRSLVSPAPTKELIGNAITWHAPPYANFGLRISYFSTGFHKNHNNAALDAAIAKAEATLEPTQRKAAALEAVKLAHDEYSWAGLLDVAEVLAIGKNVTAWKPINGYSLPAIEYARIPHAQ